MRQLLFVPALLLVANAPVPAQESRGPVLALPHAFSIDAATPLPGVGPGAIAFADAGIDGVLPPPQAPPTGMPDFTTFLGGAPVDVDALSLGLDWILSNSIGEAVVPPGQWGAITWTVSRSTIGLPGSLIASAVAEADGAAADVFAYVLPGSSLPPPLVGVPFRAQDSPETSTFVAGVPGNIDAHDLYVALLYLENPQIAAMLPPPTVYFSVTATSVPFLPMAWTAVPSLRSGATVFATTWNPTTLSWSVPIVALSPASLGLLPSEDLDALALDLALARVLFSTNPALPPPGGPRNPILFSPLGSGVHFIYRLPGGGPISTAIGLGLAPDDVDGICALDPGDAANPSQIRLPFQLGRPRPPLPLGLPTALHAAAWRRFERTTGVEHAETWMTGWPPPGAPQPGVAIVGASISGPLGPYSILGVFPRPLPGNPFAGHPEHCRIALPPTVSMTGLPLHFVWAALSPTHFDLSHPVELSM